MGNREWNLMCQIVVVVAAPATNFKFSELLNVTEHMGCISGLIAPYNIKHQLKDSQPLLTTIFIIVAV